MKILLTNNHLDNIGGSETSIYAMTKELERQGDDVDVFTLTSAFTGIARKIKNNIVKKPKKDYDLILVNHNTCYEAIKDLNGYKIFTSHGIYPPVEQPVKGFDRYIAITEEVGLTMRNKGFENNVILNGIDCERFKPLKEINKKPQKVLSLCQGGEANKNIKKVCEILGLELVIFQDLKERVFEIEKHINNADIVFTLGRGAYESMACGRDVIIYDSRGYQESLADGRITKHNFNEVVKHNCSGRRYKKKFVKYDIIEEINRYKKSNGKDNRNIALSKLSIKDKVKEYKL